MVSIWLGFFGDLNKLKIHSEINWPLAAKFALQMHSDFDVSTFHALATLIVLLLGYWNFSPLCSDTQKVSENNWNPSLDNWGRTCSSFLNQRSGQHQFHLRNTAQLSGELFNSDLTSFLITFHYIYVQKVNSFTGFTTGALH